MQDQQAAAHFPETGVEFDQAIAYEGETTVVMRKVIQDRTIEDKDAEYLPTGCQSVMQGGVVEAAQVAAEPDKGGIDASHESEGMAEAGSSPLCRKIICGSRMMF